MISESCCTIFPQSTLRVAQEENKIIRKFLLLKYKLALAYDIPYFSTSASWCQQEVAAGSGLLSPSRNLPQFQISRLP
jgi:hypothetical protein